MGRETARESLGSRLKAMVAGFRGRATSRTTPTSDQVTFRLMYGRFREILGLNDGILGLIADIEDRLMGSRPFSLEVMISRVRKAAMDVFVMVKNLNQIAGARHHGLYDALYRIHSELEAAIGPRPLTEAPLVLRIADLRAADAPRAGAKMANLGEVAGCCGLPVPEGFAVTTVAVVRFLESNALWGCCQRLEGILELEGAAALATACDDVRSAILASQVPEDMAAAISEAFDATFSEAQASVAVRSSAVGEDSASASHAGLYETELNVDRPRLLDAYRKVVASAFSPTAVVYRFERGLASWESLMAVGCLRMVVPRCAGIAYSRPPDDTGADAVVVSVTAGLADRLAAGAEGAEISVVVPRHVDRIQSALLGSEELRALVQVARGLEDHFGVPQDIEWAIDQAGRLVILQTRPMVAIDAEDAATVEVPPDRQALLAGGFTGCPGVGFGPVVRITSDGDLARFPEGGVLLARHSSPVFARAMGRCAAIVTDVGVPTGHMASLAREFGIPAIVGMAGATAALQPGQFVTVDATACRVFAGAITAPGIQRQGRRPLTDSPALARLRRMGRLVTPLSLTDPAAPEFSPDGCRSLHDITRLVHERAYEVMFHYGDMAREDRHHSATLDARLPILVRVFDVGNGISVERTGAPRVTPAEIVSVPMAAFLEGLLEPGIRWDRPRPVSPRGFLSVLGEGLAAPPAEALQVGRVSYAIVSDRYMNFSTKAGYHFSTVDTYCGRSQNKNYIHFRFHGGGADLGRRERRVRFLSAVLRALDFHVQVRGDLLTARLDKYAGEAIRGRLMDLGRLTLCARQLDMLMDSDASPDHFARAFLGREWEKF